MDPTRRDSATFRDIGTEVPSLSREKGTTGQAQNLAMGWDNLGQPVKIQDEPWEGIGKSLYLVLEHLCLFLEHTFPVLECPFLS